MPHRTGARARVRQRPRLRRHDEITDADRAWVAEHHRGSALLRRIDPRVGLTAEDFAVLGAWATGLG
ncbi:hypothetical protein GCM10010341_56190 [Streptomyces noursei]|nr:hypothetical protein GCM10010341_56190 [Streptomyces noursei]